MVYYQVKEPVCTVVVGTNASEQTGIGTYTDASNTSGLRVKVDQLLDSMIAWHLDAHVKSMFA